VRTHDDGAARPHHLEGRPKPAKGDGLSDRPTAVARRRSSPDPTVVLWRALGSIELCAALLGLLGAASLAASLLPQMPLEVRTGASPLAEWLLGRREQFGSLTPWMQAMSLFDVAHSWWFRLLIATLGVSLSVAVLRRAPAVLGASGRAVPRARRSPAGSRSQARLVRTIGSSLAEADARGVVVRTLRSLGYRLEAASAVGEPAVLRATRRRWARYGSLAAHVGLLLVLCASVVGAVTGFRDNNVMLVEGSTLPIGHGTGLSLRNDGFTPSWRPEVDVAQDFTTLTTLLKGGNPVVENHAVRVNAPLRYNGVTVHQASFGPAVELRLTGADGAPLFSGGVPLPNVDTAGRPWGVLSTGGYRLEIVAPRLNGTDRETPAGTMLVTVAMEGRAVSASALAPQGRPTAVGGVLVEFVRERQYSGLTIVQEPAAPFVWLGALLLLLGTSAVFYFPHRLVWATVVRAPDGPQVVVEAGPSRAMGRRQEFDRVHRGLARALTSPPKRTEQGAAVRRAEERQS